MTVISVRQQQVVEVPVVQVGGRRQGLYRREVANLDRGPDAAVRVLDQVHHRALCGLGDVVVRGDEGRGRERG
jgi:hypothetical protein